MNPAGPHPPTIAWPMLLTLITCGADGPTGRMFSPDGEVPWMGSSMLASPHGVAPRLASESDRERLAYHPPDSHSIGGLVVRERVRPMRPIWEVVAAELRARAAIFDAPAPGPIERLVTDEGEEAGLQTVRARSRVHAVPLSFAFGFVLGTTSAMGSTAG